MHVGQHRPRIANIEAFSSAYLALLQALREAMAMAMGDGVLVAGSRVRMRVQRVGVATMIGSDVQQPARDFRGA